MIRYWANSKQRIAWCSTLCISFIAASGGCERRIVLGKVSGRVTYNGQAVTDTLVLFADHEHGRHITAEVDAKGKYLIQTAIGWGLPLGTYQVSLLPKPVAAPIVTTGPIITAPLPESSKIPEKFRNPNTSGLKLTAVEGENVFDINLSE